MTMSDPLKVPDPSYFNEELRLFRDMVVKFLEKEMVPKADQWEQQGYVERDSWRRAGEMGLLVPSCPESLGGAGGTFAHEAIIIEEASRLGVEGLNLATHNVVFSRYLVNQASEEQQAKWLPNLLSGDWNGSIAMTEPGAGSDLRAMRTKARREGNEYVVSGQKTFITQGYSADLILLACKTAEDAISLIFVETKDLEGFSRGEPFDKIGMKAHDTTELFFDEVRVPRTNLLGEEGSGFSQMMQGLVEERMVVAIQAVGMIERALELTLDHVKDRKAFGRTIFEFQNTRFKLAELSTEATVGKVFMHHCIQSILNGSITPDTAAMAKLWLSELQGKVVDECLQLFGGYGYINEYPIARMYRDARVSRIYAGTNEIMKQVISKGL